MLSSFLMTVTPNSIYTFLRLGGHTIPLLLSYLQYGLHEFLVGFIYTNTSMFFSDFPPLFFLVGHNSSS